MISVDQAIELIKQTVAGTSGSVVLPLEEALGFVLAEDVLSTIDMPPFRQSAMDGYALCTNGELNYEVVGEVAAGSSLNPSLAPGEAVRIFTGAPVPDSANSIVIQERVSREGKEIILEEQPNPEANIRPQGEQLKKGQVALSAGHRLNPASVGLLASTGISRVRVSIKPKVSVVVTGDELMAAGTPLGHGQIYESNGIMLQSILLQKGYTSVSVVKARDNFDELKQTLEQAIADSDFTLVSGGISVGDYDFAGSALDALGVKEVFYKVKQKPGKPLFFGTKDDKLVFALPGNPASALSCFYSYVLLALKLWESDVEAAEPLRKAILTADFTKKGNRAQFLKARVNADSLTVLDGQASSMLQSFARANALAFIDEQTAQVKAGEEISYLKID